MPTRTRVAVLVAALLAAACSTGTPGAVPSPREAQPTDAQGFTGPSSFSADTLGEVDPELLEPLRMLPECPDPPPESDDHEDVPGLVLPADAVVTHHDEAGELTNLQGWMPMTPIQIRVHYQFEQDELEAIQMEDEVRESESLLGDGEHRLFVKAQAACDEGSVFVAVLAPEVASDAVPEPAGTLTPRAGPGVSESPGD